MTSAASTGSQGLKKATGPVVGPSFRSGLVGVTETWLSGFEDYGRSGSNGWSRGTVEDGKVTEAVFYADRARALRDAGL